MRIQRFSNYRTLVRERLKAVETGGRGKNDSLAQSLGVSSSHISQVLSSKRELTTEQACSTASFLGLSDLETEYFLGLVQLERTSSTALKQVLNTQLERVRGLLEANEENASLSANGHVLSPADQGIFYSQWYYSAIRLMASIGTNNTPEKIAQRLGVPQKKVQDAIDFLVRTGLCIKKDSRLSLGPSRTYTQRGSPFHSRHHLNWRVKALEYLPKEQPNGMSYTAAVSLSAEDASKIRDILVEATEKAEAMIDPSPSETVYCLTLDWFEL